ncbi:alpha/beta fold hydrolase [Mycolicibacterium aichiense]|uniref:Alpha/beta hydrolase n=2 Tax=Mycolicibacterium TaxID=1866885 RepID=A0AAD1MB94_9MYCO|nr:alpha/beta hydrolase [Mycolicibacterium aichiense]MCV7019165.1 alpha/beta hydrolase [Mycolicibacterium aichiense]BBX06315.1 alpha/beta hydrolase [Mycolicibacterium aichiense]STZ24343.1 alpha/beta hydrolase [Mycolicibacterium aichiense]
MHYDLRLRPAQPPTPEPGAFTVHRDAVPPTPGRDGLTLGYVREGAQGGAGYPLLLLHGYPETKRIWWRNIAALAEAGYEVIAPDLRGHGDSDVSADDVYDIAAYSRDVYLLVHDVLGHDRCGVVGGDVGGVVAVDLLHRYPGFVDKLVFFDTVPPLVFDDYVAAGLDPMSILSDGPTGDYRQRQGATPDELAAELDTPDKRRRYIGEMYGHRLWASPGTFSSPDVDFMTEPFDSEERLRAGWAVYQLAHGRPVSETPIMDRKVDVPTLILYGMDDHVVGPEFVHFCEVAFTNRTGPVVLPGAGHFLQWERADLFNALVSAFFGDLRVRHELSD